MAFRPLVRRCRRATLRARVRRPGQLMVRPAARSCCDVPGPVASRSPVRGSASFRSREGFGPPPRYARGLRSPLLDSREGIGPTGARGPALRPRSTSAGASRRGPPDRARPFPPRCEGIIPAALLTGASTRPDRGASRPSIQERFPRPPRGGLTGRRIPRLSARRGRAAGIAMPRLLSVVEVVAWALRKGARPPKGPEPVREQRPLPRRSPP